MFLIKYFINFALCYLKPLTKDLIFYKFCLLKKSRGLKNLCFYVVYNIARP